MERFIPFSERYGYENPEEILKENYENMTPRLRTRIWNLVVNLIRDMEEEQPFIPFITHKKITNFIWDFCGKSLDELYMISRIGAIRDLRTKINFDSWSWNKIYDFLEHIYRFLVHEGEPKSLRQESERIPVQEEKYNGLHTKFESQVNQVLESEKAPYRMIKGCITPITNEKEIKAIKEALEKLDKFKPAKDHLYSSLKLLSDRENPDYTNSVKESISAVEAILKIINKNNETLGKNIKNTCEKFKLHPAFCEAISKLYGWTSEYGGARHGKKEEKEILTHAEAKFTLITASAFINYLIEKLKGVNS